MRMSLQHSGNTAKAFEHIIDKTFDLLNGQYEIDLKFVRKEYLDHDLLFQLKVIENNLLVYPVSFAGIFKGFIEIHFSNPLSLIEINKVKNLLSLCVKSPSKYFERSVLLDQLENHLRLQSIKGPSKIINFNDFKKNKLSGQTSGDFTFNTKTNPHPPIFIEGTDIQDVEKLAFELHHFLKHKSFVHFTDIAKNIVSIEDLFTLKESTIFVRDVNCLSFKHKVLLLDYFTEYEIDNHPLIISSAFLPYSDLLKNNLNRTLLKFMSTYHIKLTKSLDEIKENGLTSFLRSSLQSPKYSFNKH